MLDPIPAPAFLRDLIQPLADALHLGTLPLHIHEVLASFVAYSFIYAVLSPILSAYLFPDTYAKFPPRTQLQWNMHVTSLVNSLFLCVAASYILLCDTELRNETWEERIWGYTGAGAMVQAFGAGYFVWDVQVCATNLGMLGVPDLMHAVVALVISVLGFVRSAAAPVCIPSS
jgi:hypothetical protein